MQERPHIPAPEPTADRAVLTGPRLLLDEVASTQDEVRRLLHAFLPAATLAARAGVGPQPVLQSGPAAKDEQAGRQLRHLLTVAARYQSSGRGRQGRAWLAAKDAAVLTSLGFILGDATAGRLCRQAALAAAVCIERLVAHKAFLKWPNDVLLDGRKVAGILLETAPLPACAAIAPAQTGRRRDRQAAQAGADVAPACAGTADRAGRDDVRVAVLGIGINVLAAPVEQAAWLAQYRPDVTVSMTLDLLLAELDRILTRADARRELSDFAGRLLADAARVRGAAGAELVLKGAAAGWLIAAGGDTLEQLPFDAPALRQSAVSDPLFD